MGLRDFCDLLAEKILGIYDAKTHQIPHDHSGRAGEHLRQHSSHCRAIAIQTATAMGMTEKLSLAAIAIAVEHHDVGKMWVNPFIISKEGELTDWEFDIMRQHVSWRNVAKIMEREFNYSYPTIPKLVTDFAIRHQQKTRDVGYPSNEELPFQTYDMLDMMKFVDELQAGICKERKWRAAKGLKVMKAELTKKGEDGLLNPYIVKAFFSVKHKDIFHSEFVRPVTQTEIVHKAGKIPMDVYNRLVDFKIAT